MALSRSIFALFFIIYLDICSGQGVHEVRPANYGGHHDAAVDSSHLPMSVLAHPKIRQRMKTMNGTAVPTGRFFGLLKNMFGGGRRPRPSLERGPPRLVGGRGSGGGFGGGIGHGLTSILQNILSSVFPQLKNKEEKTVTVVETESEEEGLTFPNGTYIKTGKKDYYNITDHWETEVVWGRKK